MKVKLNTYEFNDKSFWMMFDPPEAIDYFYPNNAKWQRQGVQFSIQDSSEHKYIRKIELWAEHEDETVITTMLLTEDNK